MPPDLAAALDTGVCSELQARFASANAWEYNDYPEAHVWWTQLLPDFVAELRAQRDAARAELERRNRADQIHVIDAFLRQHDAAVTARDTAREARDAAVAAITHMEEVLDSKKRLIDSMIERIDMLETYIGTLEAALEHLNPDWRQSVVRHPPVCCGMCCTDL